MTTTSILSFDVPCLAAAAGTADAIGTHSYAQGATATGVAGGMAVAFAGFAAVAQNTDATAPQTVTTATAETIGGNIAGSHTNYLTIEFFAGSTPISASISVAVATAHGFESLPAQLSSFDHFSSIGNLTFPGMA